MAINEERYEQGIKEGKEQGIKEGMVKGSKCKQIEIAQNLLITNLPLEQISSANGLSVDEITKLQFPIFIGGISTFL